MNQHQWKQKDKTIIKIKDMDDNHLKNTIKMLQRKGQKMLDEEISAAYSCLSTFNGEMAIMTCEQDITKMEGMDGSDIMRYEHPQYNNMIKELEKRGLKL